VIAAVGGARKRAWFYSMPAATNPFENTMQRTIALKLVNKGLSNIEPEAGSWWFMPPNMVRPRSTAIPPIALRHGARARHQGAEGRGAKAVRHHPPTTSGRPPIAGSSRSPMARRPAARIFISWREVTDPHGEEAPLRRLEL